MNKKVYKTLEYNKIIEKLTSLAGSFLGKELCQELEPTDDIVEITARQQETSDAVSRLYRAGSISFGGVKEIRPSLQRLKVGSALGIEELLSISSVLDVCYRVKSYGKKEETASDDSLDPIFSSIQPLVTLNNEIKRCIISEEEISDGASATLKNIRRTIRNSHDKIHQQLNSMVNSSSTRTMLQENVITMRNGRYCLPVKLEYRSQFPGMIHDQSSTGATLFIEPMSVVRLNNDLKELSIKEQEEIERILAELSALAAEELDALTANLESLKLLDFIFAKASLSRHYNCSEPIFNDRGYINIKKGRHPLLDPKKVVPIDIYLGKDFNMLVVTGPNTGGKTVSLKTVGLLTLMGQAGLHIPAFDNSELAVFSNIYADIGDEQSIEQSLSTFSSHMTNIISIIENASYDTLVLFDELGAGTDPTEGAALAMSILQYLHKRKVPTMATTHYSELKVFALSTDGVENACCEFDVETLRPTYKLLIGIPGKSNAFAISQKLGLPMFIIDEAKKLITVQDRQFEDLISDLETSKLTIEREQELISQYKQEIEQLKLEHTAKQEKLEQQKEKIIREANEKAHAILQEAKDIADESIRNYTKWSKENVGHSTLENERHKLRQKLSDVEGNLSFKAKEKPNHKVPTKLRVGDAVKVLSLGLNGTVSTLPNARGDLFVQMGILKSQVNIKDIVLIDEESNSSPTLKRSGAGKISMSKTSTIRPEINLIGLTVEEALGNLDKYLDDAYLSHLPQVTVIHGKGTGTLRNAIHTYLKRLKYVKSFRLGNFGEGEAGVTIVEFK